MVNIEIALSQLETDLSTKHLNRLLQRSQKEVLKKGKKLQYDYLQSKFCNSYHRITECAELERTHHDHGVQHLALHCTPQESHHMPENII